MAIVVFLTFSNQYWYVIFDQQFIKRNTFWWNLINVPTKQQFFFSLFSCKKLRSPWGLGLLNGASNIFPILLHHYVAQSPYKFKFQIGFSILIGKPPRLNSEKISALYREFSPYANYITANFVTTVFQNYYYNFANAILLAIHFVSAYISQKFG